MMDYVVLLWGLLKQRNNKALCGINFLPALSVVNSRLLLAGVTSNVALNIAVTVAL